jgi:hypothetical protein
MKTLQPWEYVDSVRVQNYLASHYGASAMSTYYGARYIHQFTTAQSLALMRMQLSELGDDYAGGLECTKFRGKERISLLINLH